MKALATLADGQVDPPVVTRSPRLGGHHRRIGPALRARRRLRAGIVQLVYIAVAIALGVITPRFSVGVSVPASRATEMLVAVGAGFVPFIGIVYSMLVLVVQFGSTTFHTAAEPVQRRPHRLARLLVLHGRHRVRIHRGLRSRVSFRDDTARPDLPRDREIGCDRVAAQSSDRCLQIDPARLDTRTGEPAGTRGN
jgi:hypothetical protein